MADRFYYCKRCHNIVGLVVSSGVTPSCCGEEMTHLVANTVDASHEKHLPVVTVESCEDGMKIEVAVGSAAHPMTPEHLINWIYVETDRGGHRIGLTATDKPAASFILPEDETPLAVYAYCNLHGLWMTKL